MLVQFFTVEVTESQDINTLISQLSNDTPISVCMEFSNISSKHTFCVDASIDVEQICVNNGIIYEYIHDLEVLPEEYNNTRTIGTDIIGSNIYHLIFLKKNVNPFPDVSMNIPINLPMKL